MTTIDDIKIAELLELISDYLDITSIVTFYCAIKIDLPNKYIKQIKQLTLTIAELEKKLKNNNESFCSPRPYCPPKSVCSSRVTCFQRPYYPPRQSCHQGCYDCDSDSD